MKPSRNLAVRDAMQRAVSRDPNDAARELAYGMALRQRDQRRNVQPRPAPRTSPGYYLKGRA